MCEFDTSKLCQFRKHWEDGLEEVFVIETWLESDYPIAIAVLIEEKYVIQGEWCADPLDAFFCVHRYFPEPGSDMDRWAVSVDGERLNALQVLQLISKALKG